MPRHYRRSRHLYVRPARQDEAQMYFTWGEENAGKSEFDPQVSLFSSSETWCAYDSEGPVVFQTLQRPFMLESLVPRPGATKFQIASAMKELTQNAITRAHVLGVGEIYYLGSDAETDALATNQIFEELPFKVFRVKVGELCG